MWWCDGQLKIIWLFHANQGIAKLLPRLRTGLMSARQRGLSIISRRED